MRINAISNLSHSFSSLGRFEGTLERWANDKHYKIKQEAYNICTAAFLSEGLTNLIDFDTHQFLPATRIFAKKTKTKKNPITSAT
jgi:hypothetical protein